jgi:hypothetical protein
MTPSSSSPFNQPQTLYSSSHLQKHGIKSPFLFKSLYLTCAFDTTVIHTGKRRKKLHIQKGVHYSRNNKNYIS